MSPEKGMSAENERGAPHDGGAGMSWEKGMSAENEKSAPHDKGAGMGDRGAAAVTGAIDTEDADVADVTGYIDSVYCGSGVDGPGLRCVVFVNGCNLRCPFCHNPETLFKRGTMSDINALKARLLRYRGYFRRGGVTISGGEPFLQKEFTLALVRALAAEGVRCCIETNGHIADEQLIAAADIVVDIKNQQTDDLSAYEKFFAACLRQGKTPRLTNVLVPGVNDKEEKIAALARLSGRYFPGSRIRFLPFRKLCAEKYENLGIPFPFAAYREAEEEDIARAEAIAAACIDKN